MRITNTKIKGIYVDEIDGDLNQSRWSLTSTGYTRRGAIIAGGLQAGNKTQPYSSLTDAW